MPVLDLVGDIILSEVGGKWYVEKSKFFEAVMLESLYWILNNFRRNGMSLKSHSNTKGVVTSSCYSMW